MTIQETKVEVTPVRVLLESPYRGVSGDHARLADNIAYARQAMRHSMSMGETPLVSHLLYTQVLSDESANGRALGIAMHLNLIDVVDKVVAYTDRGISSGMQAAIDLARKKGIPVEMRVLYSTDYAWQPQPIELCASAAGALQELGPLIHQLNKKWWHDPATGEPVQRNFGELLMLAVSELSEALEGHRKSLKDQHLPERTNWHVEIADCMIRLFDLCGAYNVPLGDILLQKLRYNINRADHSNQARLAADGKKY